MDVRAPASPRPIAPSPWVQLPRCREPSARGVARLAQRGRGAGPYSVLVRAHGPPSPHVPLQGRPGGRGGRAVTWVRVGGRPHGWAHGCCRPRALLPGTLSGSAWAAAAALGFRPGARVAGSLSEGERAGPGAGRPVGSRGLPRAGWLVSGQGLRTLFACSTQLLSALGTVSSGDETKAKRLGVIEGEEGAGRPLSTAQGSGRPAGRPAGVSTRWPSGFWSGVEVTPGCWAGARL